MGSVLMDKKRAYLNDKRAAVQALSGPGNACRDGERPGFAAVPVEAGSHFAAPRETLQADGSRAGQERQPADRRYKRIQRVT